jgi:preprotein translocase subunit SecB
MATPEPAGPPERQPGISIAQIFLERVSFEHRGDALNLPSNTPPRVGDVSVKAEFGIGGDNQLIGLTRITVSTRPDQDPVYNVVVAMVAVFTREPTDEAMPLRAFLENNSVTLMYPFVREAFANVTQRGRFGAVFLNPFNTRAGWRDEPIPSGSDPNGREAGTQPQP